MKKLIDHLQEIGISLRLKFPGRNDCRDCINSTESCTGDGWNEPREYEWSCGAQERELEGLVFAYENAVGEVNYDFATICPLYREITDTEREAEVDYDENW